jgi:FkbM family methyltransferase
MKKLFDSLQALPRPIGHIIHVGAGLCSELQSYENLEPQQIVLIEADIKQVTELINSTQSKKNIDILAYAIAEKEKEQQTLKKLTNQRDSSLLMPEKILEYYPSLAIVEEQRVTTETLDNLLQNYTMDNSYHHVLILEVQGLESLIIKTTSVELLLQFSGIIIRSSTEQLYKQEQQENVIDCLELIGFDFSHQENERYNSVFTRLYFQRNNEKIELIDSNRQIEHLTKQLSDLENDLNNIRNKDNKLLQELDEAKQTTALSIKLQMLKENDLKDLQQRYQDALITQENQHELLNKLSERMSLAAGYFHQISQDQSEQNQPQLADEKKQITQKEKSRHGIFRLFNFIMRNDDKF